MATTETTGPRLDWKAFQEIVPEVATGMAAVTHALRKSGLEAELIEMVKVRVSQLNGCAFCVQFHLNDARKVGVAAEKLDLLAAWREAGIYSPREAAALDWAEQVTLQAQRHIDDEAFGRVSAVFSERELAFLTTAIGQINFWNRIAAPFRFTPPIPRAVA
ncbi:MAG TPA: carboxymuconolactone decarboxylase family protein [Terracidiphilus sp.]|nr:carboxymuconolactone decarboxylase family protein [Terracidiphilus sp.]